MEILPNPLNRIRTIQKQLLTTQSTRPGYETPGRLSARSAFQELND
jgi:hypothetical protein